MTNLRKGLVGHWTMDNRDTSSGKLYDRTPYNNHGTLNGAPTTGTSGIVGEAYTFDAVDDWVDVSSPLPYSGTVTVVLWIAVNTSDADWDSSPSRREFFHDDVVELDQKVNQNVAFFYDGTGVGDVNNSSYAFPEDEWELATLRYDGSTVELIRGTEVLDTASHSNLASPTVAPRIGANYSDSSRVWGGDIAEVRVYDRALSNAEIKSIYNIRSARVQQSSLKSSLVGHWTMDNDDVDGGVHWSRAARKFDAETRGTPSFGVSGVVDGAASLVEADGDYLPIRNNSYATSDTVPELSVSAWVKTTNSDQYVMQYDRSELFRATTNNFSTHNGGVHDMSHTGAEDGNWHHLVFWYDNDSSGDRKRIYLDGSVSASVVDPHNGNPLSPDVERYGSIGAFGESGTFDGDESPRYTGDIDDVRLYERALDESEIATLYNKRQI